MKSYSYISRKPCGCLAWAAVDTPANAKSIARAMASAVRFGIAVERVTTEDVRTMPWRCAEHDPKRQGRLGLAEASQ